MPGDPSTPPGYAATSTPHPTRPLPIKPRDAPPPPPARPLSPAGGRTDRRAAVTTGERQRLYFSIPLHYRGNCTDLAPPSSPAPPQAGGVQGPHTLPCAPSGAGSSRGITPHSHCGAGTALPSAPHHLPLPRDPPNWGCLPLRGSSLRGFLCLNGVRVGGFLHLHGSSTGGFSLGGCLPLCLAMPWATHPRVPHRHCCVPPGRSPIPCQRLPRVLLEGLLWGSPSGVEEQLGGVEQPIPAQVLPLQGSVHQCSHLQGQGGDEVRAQPRGSVGWEGSSPRAYHVGVWLPPIPLCQHCAQQLQQLQPVQAPAPVMVVQHEEVEQGCGAQGAVGLGPCPCPCQTPGPRCRTALPCSRVMASTSRSGGPRLLTALCSSLGAVGLGVGTHHPAPQPAPELLCPIAPPRTTLPHRQLGTAHALPSPLRWVTPRCAAPGAGVQDPVPWGSPRGRDSQQRGQLRAQRVRVRIWTRGHKGLRPGQERGRYLCPWGGLPALAWPDVPAVPHTASPPPTASPAPDAPLCPPALPVTMHPPDPCTHPQPHAPATPMHPHLHPRTPSVPVHPPHAQAPICTKPHLHPLYPHPPPYLCPPALGAAHAARTGSSSRASSRFLIPQPRAAAGREQQGGHGHPWRGGGPGGAVPGHGGWGGCRGQGACARTRHLQRGRGRCVGGGSAPGASTLTRVTA